MNKLTFLHDVQKYHGFFFRSDESLGSPSSSITGISNGSAGAAEKSSLRMDNVNNNNNQNNMLVVGGNNTNVNSGSGGLLTLHNNSQHINNISYQTLSIFKTIYTVALATMKRNAGTR